MHLLAALLVACGTPDPAPEPEPEPEPAPAAPPTVEEAFALPLVDLDIASSLQLAGDHARRAGHDELAKKLHAWGRAQYLALGDEAAAAALA